MSPVRCSGRALRRTEACLQVRLEVGAFLEWGNVNCPNGYGPFSVLVDSKTNWRVHFAFVDEDGGEVDVAQVDSVLGPGYYAWEAQASGAGS
ncbi:hypothetical protein AB0F77_22930 [Streptomyces sp. NPDC026672]|uniref:hypothetical protein n=1 Tax=unclassified Streptomyces TaxID=2593676 RepID=UPI003405E85C